MERSAYCKRGHEFTPETTRVLNTGRRRCRICQRHYIKAWMRARRANTPWRGLGTVPTQPKVAAQDLSALRAIAVQKALDKIRPQ